MLDSIKKVFAGSDVFHRHLSLFSICGIVGLFDALAAYQGIQSFTLINKILFIVMNILFIFFYTGYETKFMHERELPDIDLFPFRLALRRFLFAVALIGLTLFFVKFKFPIGVFVFDLVLAVPLTMVQAGFSYNYQNEDAFKIFKSFGLKEYITLFFKRLLVVICSYLLVGLIVFNIFVVIGIIIGLLHKGDVTSAMLVISSHQMAIAKLSNLIVGILITYVLTIGSLAWDYELIKTYEQFYIN